MPIINLNIASNIYCWEISETENELKKLVNLSEVENALIFSHKRSQRRKEMLGARALLASVVQNSHIHYKDKKPYLVNSTKEISISNSENLVVIQLNESEEFTGVDVQFLSNTVIRVQHKYLHPSEYSLFTDENKFEILNVIWSAKESLYKAYSEEKLEFKKELIVQGIDEHKKIITGIITREEENEPFELGMYMNNDFVLTWFKTSAIR